MPNSSGAIEIPVFNGIIYNGYINNKQVVYTKEIDKSRNILILELAEKLYQTSAFSNYPEKSNKEWAKEAISRAKTFYKVAEDSKLL